MIHPSLTLWGTWKRLDNVSSSTCKQYHGGNDSVCIWLASCGHLIKETLRVISNIKMTSYVIFPLQGQKLECVIAVVILLESQTFTEAKVYE